MQFLCADADFRSKTELESVTKAAGCIDIYTGRIHHLLEFARVGIIVGYNYFGMFCTKPADIDLKILKNPCIPGIKPT